ncbi:MAG: Uma2 family endonuclease [Chloroflexi bacterium]|nr:Uma2 family endonuclease [Chloroflexota bacterium]
MRQPVVHQSWKGYAPLPVRSVATAAPNVPPLESGDRLTLYEFERRYNAMPHIKKAELIEGVVHMPSPVHHLSHGKPHAQVMGLLAVYCASTSGVDLSDNTSVRLDADNEVQPDALLRLDPAFGGRCHITPDDYLEGAPELIMEIAATSASYDLHDKKKVYRRNGVQEYVVWRVYDERLDWFSLQTGEYVSLEAGADGVIHSLVFPGLWLNVPALLEGDLARVLAELQEGLASMEHTAFVEHLT